MKNTDRSVKGFRSIVSRASSAINLVNDRTMDMDCEPLSSTVVGDDDDDRDVAISRDDDDLPFKAITYVRLRDVIPCNLRSTHDFLQSSVNLAIETRYLETFAKCYGYLMYDRSRKLSTIRSTTTRARAIARWLSEIEDIDTFRRTLYDHLIQTRSLLRDDMIDALDLDDDIDDALKKHCNDGNDGNAGNGDFFENDLKTSKQTENSNFPKTKVYGRELLRLARDLLDQVLAFLRSEDHLRRAININGFFCEIFVVDSSQARVCVENAWNATTSLDANALVSIVLKDAILSTGLETHSSLLFFVRVSLLFTFLVSQTFGRDVSQYAKNDDDSPVNVAQIFSAENEEKSESDVVFDYFAAFDAIMIKRFIGTVFVQINILSTV